MNIINLKNVLAGAFVLALFGFSQGAVAGWEDDPCGGDHSNGGPAPCFDVGGPDSHFNGDGEHAGEWHQDPNGNDFEFCGTTVLSCPIVGEFSCTLCLDGQVKKDQDEAGNWLVGVKVTGGDVSAGDLACAFIGVSGFPWYMGDQNTHQGFGEDTGIPYPGALIGNLGDVTVDVFGAPVVGDGHIHDVTYDNATSSFVFDGELFEDGNADNPSGCSVVGSLEVQGWDYVHIH